MEAWREELYHHGILGQKWGKRNGPPYPLNRESHSSSEKKAGWTKSLGGSSGSTGSSSKSSQATTYQTHSTSGSVDPKTGFKKITSSESVAQRAAQCNPKYYDSNNVTPWNRNCGNTAVAYDLRKRGLDVEARGNNWGMTFSGILDLYDGKDKNTEHNVKKLNVSKLSNKTIRMFMFGGYPDKKTTDEINSRGTQVQKEMEKQIAGAYPPNSSGVIRFHSLVFGGHFMAFEVDQNGRASIINSQNPDLDLKTYLATYSGQEIDFARLDNLSIKKNGAIKDVVMDRGSDADKHGQSYNAVKALVETGEIKVKQMAMYEKTLKQYYGPVWDGSWDEFDPSTQRIKVNILRR